MRVNPRAHSGALLPRHREPARGLTLGRSCPTCHDSLTARRRIFDTNNTASGWADGMVTVRWQAIHGPGGSDDQWTLQRRRRDADIGKTSGDDQQQPDAR